MATRSELQELIDSPNEVPAVEYKEWLDFSAPGVRADIARHVAALSNYGGGFLVFGFQDDMQPGGPNPYATKCTRDLIAGIVRRYLEPPIQCDVADVVAGQGGESHPVVIVPPHGATPICAKAGGPVVNGKPEGIVEGTYYTRKIGPESAPIRTAAEWAPIIRRCALHDRAALLDVIDAALRGRSPAQEQDDEDRKLLLTWHKAADAVFRADVVKYRAPPRMESQHWQMTYAIAPSSLPAIGLDELLEVARQINLELKGFVNTGWSLFYPFTRPGIAPHFATDPHAGLGDREFLEAALLRDDQGPRTEHADFWRISPNGLATIVLDYVEDDADRSRAVRVQPGTWFNPNLMVSRLAEFVHHARVLAERLPGATNAAFRCEWHGLENRQSLDPESMWVSGPRALQGHRASSGTWPASSIAGDWPEIVAELCAPVCRLFGIERFITPAWILRQSTRWRSLGRE
jgi:hypothetical protein